MSGLDPMALRCARQELLEADLIAHKKPHYKVLSLPDETRLFMCHDYGPNGRDIQWETTVAEERAFNIHVGGDATRESFVKMRTERDATLAMPKLIIPALQVNIRAGEVPTDEDGRPSLKVPINSL